MTNTTLLGAALVLSLAARAARADGLPPATGQAPAATSVTTDWHLGAHAELDVGVLIALRQGAAFGGGVTYGPFRAGVSYATFLSSASLGGVPDGFDLRVNYLLGINAAYFIGQRTDEGLYVQGMFHIKQQGVTNQETGAHVDLDSLALGIEIGFVWRFYEGAYVAPRVGALYYVDKPQPGNEPIQVGDRAYDNQRHHDWDTYFIPTISVGYSW